MRRICFKRSNLVANVEKLKHWFRERGYLEDMVNKDTKRSLETPSLGCSKISEISVLANGGIEEPLVINYSLFLCRLGLVIRKNLCFLYQDEEVKKVFTPPPFVSFCSIRTIRSYPVRVKVYLAGEKLVGSRKRCQVCKNVIETHTFQTFVGKKLCKIHHRFTCSNKWLVYLLSCKVYGMQ